MQEEVRKYIDTSVLCWLATVSVDGQPNVSPKEVFTYLNDQLIIANIASPQSVKNIESNDRVCVSFIDILIQKGFQVTGKAKNYEKDTVEYKKYEPTILKITQDKYPVQSIIVIDMVSTKRIIAPSYALDPERTEQQQVDQAKKAYGF